MESFDLRRACLDLKKALQQFTEGDSLPHSASDAASIAHRMSLVAQWLTCANRVERGVTDLLWEQRWSYTQAVERVAQAFRESGSEDSFTRGMADALEIEIESSRQLRDCENLVWSLRMAAQACRNQNVFARCIASAIVALDLILGNIEGVKSVG